MTKDKHQQGHETVCAQEDYCIGCGNFDAFFNSCKLAAYKARFSERTEKIHPRTNGARWLLAIVGCASDTRSTEQRKR